MIKNRPKSIIWFSWLFWGGIFVSYLGDSIFNENTLDFLWLDIIVLGLLALFWYLIYYRANNLLKWVYSVVVFVGIGFFVLVIIASNKELGLLDNELLDVSLSEITVGIVINMLSLCSLICLFSRTSQIWFESKGKITEQANNQTNIFE